MLRACLLALLLAACSDDGGGAPDAPMGLDGAWRATWTCEAGCGHSPPYLMTASGFAVAGAAVEWTVTPPQSSAGERVAECIAVPVGPLPVGWISVAFDLCADGAVAAATIEIHNGDGTRQARWRLDAVRE